MFGEAVRAQRQLHGLTQEDLAGVSVRTLRGIEAGRVG